MKPFETRLFLTFMLTTALVGSHDRAYASCTMPGGAPNAEAGDIIFNGPPHNVMQYCNGANWVPMSGGGGAADNLGDHIATQNVRFHSSAGSIGVTGAETDPKVGSVTNNKWCRGDGTQIICDQDAPTGGSGGSLTCAGGVDPQVYDNRCYTRFDNLPSSWDNALEHCAAWGGPGAGLVIIDDADENNFITTNYASANAWIGATDNGLRNSGEGNPRWWDGTVLVYTNWNAPHDNHNNRDYVYLTPTGTWRFAGSAAGSGTLPYICEAPNPYASPSATMTCSNGTFHGQITPPPPPPCGSMTLGGICINGALASLGMARGSSCPPTGDNDEADGDLMWLKALDPDIQEQILINKRKGRL